MPARVLHLIPSLGAGGSERQAIYLVNHLPALGWDVHIAMVRPGVNFLQLAANAHTYLLAAHNNHDPRLLLSIRNVIRQVRPDVIQTWLRQMDLAGGLMALAHRLPWILSERSSAEGYTPSAKHRMRQVMARYCSGVVANAQTGRRYWQGCRLPARVRLEVIPNALDLEAIRAAPPVDLREEGLVPDQPVLLVAGRLDAEKNLHTLVRALPEILSGSNAVVVFCGEGCLRKDIESLVQRAGLSGRVLFKGFVRNLWSWLKAARAALSVSLFEGSPNVVLEAMACRCPLVVSDIAGHRECLADDMAIFVDPRDPHSIAHGTLDCLANPDPAAARADRAAASLGNRSPSQCALRYHRLYQEVLARP